MSDIQMGFDAGATDYLTKPYSLELLVLKVKALAEQFVRSKKTVFFLGGLKLDCITRRAYMNDEDLLLRAKEFALLEMLARNPGQYIGSEELYSNVWGVNVDGDYHSVWEHMSKLRKKFSSYTQIRIETERNKGYRLTHRQDHNK
jgi:DNA-binding response OmpR family regulator